MCLCRLSLRQIISETDRNACPNNKTMTGRGCTRHDSPLSQPALAGTILCAKNRSGAGDRSTDRVLRCLRLGWARPLKDRPRWRGGPRNPKCSTPHFGLRVLRFMVFAQKIILQYNISNHPACVLCVPAQQQPGNTGGYLGGEGVTPLLYALRNNRANRSTLTLARGRK